MTTNVATTDFPMEKDYNQTFSIKFQNCRNLNMLSDYKNITNYLHFSENPTIWFSAMKAWIFAMS